MKAEVWEALELVWVGPVVMVLEPLVTDVVKPELVVVALPDAVPDAVPEPEPEPELDGDGDADADTDAEPDAEPEAEPVAEDEAEPLWLEIAQA